MESKRNESKQGRREKVSKKKAGRNEVRKKELSSLDHAHFFVESLNNLLETENPDSG